jgi:hypothetical protein
MRSGDEEKPDHPGPQAGSGKVAAIVIALIITALFVALLRFVMGL